MLGHESVRATHKLEEVDDALRDFQDRCVETLVLVGGDGTVGVTLTRAVELWAIPICFPESHSLAAARYPHLQSPYEHEAIPAPSGACSSETPRSTAVRWSGSGRRVVPSATE